MDVLTLASAKKYAKALVEAMGGDVEELEKALEKVEDDLGDLGDDVSIVNLDGDTASQLIINRLRQHIWQNEADAPVCEAGSVTLTNTAKFPFNNSKKSVALAKVQADLNYAVIAWTDSEAGNIGDIQVTEKQVNGFKVSYSGSASTAVVNYIVIGGIVK